MAVRKADLKDFLDKKITQQVKATEKARDTFIKECVDPVINHMFAAHDFGGVERVAARLFNDYEQITQDFPGIEYEISTGMLRRLNLLSDVRGAIRVDLHDKIIQHLTTDYSHYRDKHLSYKCPELNETVVGLESKVMKFAKKLNDLKTLRKETETAVNNAINGNRAYKDLVSLGLDMSEFKESESQLPAIIKLSVEPCLLSGDCSPTEVSDNAS